MNNSELAKSSGSTTLKWNEKDVFSVLMNAFDIQDENLLHILFDRDMINLVHNFDDSEDDSEKEFVKKAIEETKTISEWLCRDYGFITPIYNICDLLFSDLKFHSCKWDLDDEEEEIIEEQRFYIYSIYGTTRTFIEHVKTKLGFSLQSTIDDLDCWI